jgi:hypothetical protein
MRLSGGLIPSHYQELLVNEEIKQVEEGKELFFVQWVWCQSSSC